MRENENLASVESDEDLVFYANGIMLLRKRLKTSEISSF